MTYTDVKDKTYKLLKKKFPTLEILFRNANQDTLLIIIRSSDRRNAIQKVLADSGYFKTRNFKSETWKFTLISDDSIYNNFKSSKTKCIQA